MALKTPQEQQAINRITKAGNIIILKNSLYQKLPFRGWGQLATNENRF